MSCIIGCCSIRDRAASAIDKEGRADDIVRIEPIRNECQQPSGGLRRLPGALVDRRAPGDWGNGIHLDPLGRNLLARLRIVEFDPALNFEPPTALFFAQPGLSEALQEALHQLGRLVRDVRPDPCQRQLGLLVSQRGQKQPSLINSPGIG